MSGKICLVCGRPVEAATGFDLCAACVKATGEKAAAAAAPAPPPAPRPRWVPWAVVAVCGAVAAVRMPQVKAAWDVLFPPPPAAEADPAAACLAELWAASALIQEGRWTPGALACPLSGAFYGTRGAGEDLEVSCPNPGSHGLKALRVSRRSPIPESLPL